MSAFGLNNNYQSNGGYDSNNKYSPTVYSSFSFANKESKIDKSMISFSMWKTTMRISIYPAIETENDEVRYDRNNSISIFITPIKCNILADLLENFIKDPETYSGKMVVSGNNTISIATGDTVGKPESNAFISIRKVNPNNGKTEQSYAYEFRSDYYIIESFDENTGKYESNYESYKFEELKAMITQLREYYKASTYANAFTTYNTLFDPLDKIASKLGTTLTNNGYGNSNKQPSYFAQNKSQFTGGVSNNTVNDGTYSTGTGASLSGLMG